MVDWSLARQIARFAAGSQPQPDLKFDFDSSVADAERHLAAYTSLALTAPAPPPERVDRAVADLKIDRDSFLGWVVLHELTHVFQFSGVAWLRGHLGGLLEEYLATVDVRVEHGAAGGLPSIPNLQRLVELFREGGLIALVQTREQRRIMDGVQATMAV